MAQKYGGKNPIGAFGGTKENTGGKGGICAGYKHRETEPGSTHERKTRDQKKRATHSIREKHKCPQVRCVTRLRQNHDEETTKERSEQKNKPQGVI